MLKDAYVTYMERKQAWCQRVYFAEFQRKFRKNIDSRRNQALVDMNLQLHSWKTVFYTLREYTLRKSRNREILILTEDSRQFNTLKNIFSFWSDYCPLSKRTRDNSFRGYMFQVKSYKLKAFHSLLIYTEKRKESNFRNAALRNYYLEKKVQTAWKSLAVNTQKNNAKRGLYYQIDLRRLRILTLKTWTVLKNYPVYKTQKNLVYSNEKIAIRKISNRRWLKNWYRQVFNRAKVRTFNFKMIKLMRKVFMRRMKDLKYSDHRKMIYIQEKAPGHMKNQFFVEWKKRISYKKFCQKNHLVIKAQSEMSLRSSGFGFWLEKTKRVVRYVRLFSRALVDLRKIFLKKYLVAWKYRVRTKKVPQLLARKQRALAKVQVFAALRNLVQWKRRVRKISWEIQKKSETKLLAWIWSEVRHVKQKRKFSQSKGQELYLMSKRKF
jgi:hypothetical protein